MRVPALILSSALCLAGCTETQSLKPSQLNANADKYDGKKVQVIGWLAYNFEDVGIWDSSKDHGERKNRNCVSYSGPRLGNEYEDQFVILRGTFKKRIIPPDMVSLTNCSDSGLKVEGHPLGR
jgi:hypothetical protein